MAAAQPRSAPGTALHRRLCFPLPGGARHGSWEGRLGAGAAGGLPLSALFPPFQESLMTLGADLRVEWVSVFVSGSEFGKLKEISFKDNVCMCRGWGLRMERCW